MFFRGMIEGIKDLFLPFSIRDEEEPTFSYHGETIKLDPLGWYILSSKRKLTEHPLWDISKELCILPNIELFGTNVNREPVRFSRADKLGTIAWVLTEVRFTDKMHWDNKAVYYTVSEEDFRELQYLNEDNIMIYNAISDQTFTISDPSDLIHLMIGLQYHEREQLKEDARQRAIDKKRKEEEELNEVKEDIKQMFLNDKLNTVYQVQDPTQAELERVDYMNLEKILTDFTIQEEKS